MVERLVGRLMTDEEFRFAFTRAPEATLRALCEQGWELSHAEFEALINTDVAVWTETAERIDPRLQRCSLRGGTAEGHESK
jgi:hypothetical protein